MLLKSTGENIYNVHTWKGSWIYNYLHVRSVHITTKVVSYYPAHGEVYSIQHYVTKSVSDLKGNLR